MHFLSSILFLKLVTIVLVHLNAVVVLGCINDLNAVSWQKQRIALNTHVRKGFWQLYSIFIGIPCSQGNAAV